MSVSDRLRERLRKDRPMRTISMRMPEDVIRELKEMAPKLGFSGYQPLIRFYIGRGMRADAAALSQASVAEAEETEAVEESEAADAPMIGETAELPPPGRLYVFPARPDRLGRSATREQKAEKLRAAMAAGQH